MFPARFVRLHVHMLKIGNWKFEIQGEKAKGKENERKVADPIVSTKKKRREKVDVLFSFLLNIYEG